MPCLNATVMKSPDSIIGIEARFLEEDVARRRALGETENWMRHIWLLKGLDLLRRERQGQRGHGVL